jgi:predicted phosphodiesterase
MRRFLIVFAVLFSISLMLWAERPQFGPYLIYPGSPDQMMVLWNLKTSSSCTLRWGLDDSCSTGSFECSGTKATRLGNVSEMFFPGGYDYRVTLESLSPGTLYYYEVEADGYVASSTFRTAPSDDADSVRFLAWADTQFATEETCQWPPCCFGDTAINVLNHVKSDQSLQTMMLHAGDWVANPGETAWRDYLRNPSNRELMSLVPQQGTIGNHDVVTNLKRSGDSYLKYLPYPYVDEHYWSFDYGPLHIVIVDQFRSGMCDVSSTRDQAQMDWIADDLASNEKPWTIVLFHMPQYEGEGEDPESQCENLLSVLDPSLIDLLLAGHWHMHRYSTELGIPQLIMGSASDRHQQGGCMYYLFDISGSKLSIEVYESGQKIDTIVLTKP